MPTVVACVDPQGRPCTQPSTSRRFAALAPAPFPIIEESELLFVSFLLSFFCVRRLVTGCDRNAYQLEGVKLVVNPNLENMGM